MSVNSGINEMATAGMTGAPTGTAAGARGATRGQTASGGPRPAPGTLIRLFFGAVERYDKPAALQHKEGGSWR
jgi:hypothetical protein